VQAARTQFFATGFSKVTTDELSASLGISKKTLYQHFESKEALVRAVMALQTQEVKAGIEAIVQDPSQGFLDKLHRLLGFMTMHLSRIRPAFLDDLRRKAPDIWQEVEQFRREQVFGMVARLLQEGEREGLFRPDIPAAFFILMWFSVMERVFTAEVLADLPFSASQAFQYFQRVLFEGMLTDTARARFEAEVLPDFPFTL
jgi:AcrR family transcriptional regulator